MSLMEMFPGLGTKVKRTYMSKTQKQALLKRFQTNLYPEKGEICQLAKTFHMKEKRIKDLLSKMRTQKRATGSLLSPSE